MASYFNVFLEPTVIETCILLRKQVCFPRGKAEYILKSEKVNVLTNRTGKPIFSHRNLNISSPRWITTFSLHDITLQYHRL